MLVATIHWREHTIIPSVVLLTYSFVSLTSVLIWRQAHTCNMCKTLLSNLYMYNAVCDILGFKWKWKDWNTKYWILVDSKSNTNYTEIVIFLTYSICYVYIYIYIHISITLVKCSSTIQCPDNFSLINPEPGKGTWLIPVTSRSVHMSTEPLSQTWLVK